MNIKNYTTKVPANQSIQEIQESLLKHGATQFLLEYEQGTGRIQSLKFILELGGQKIPFSMPLNWQVFQKVMKEQGNRRWNDEDYCYRVAWRVLRDWVMVNMALYETQMIDFRQMFLAYAVMKDGRTLFEQVVTDPKFLLN
jgi:hypothetical protein